MGLRPICIVSDFKSLIGFWFGNCLEARLGPSFGAHFSEEGRKTYRAHTAGYHIDRYHSE